MVKPTWQLVKLGTGETGNCLYDLFTATGRRELSATGTNNDSQFSKVCTQDSTDTINAAGKRACKLVQLEESLQLIQRESAPGANRTRVCNWYKIKTRVCN